MGTHKITDQEQSLLSALLFLYELTQEEEVLDQSIFQFLKDNNVVNSQRVAGYLVENKFLDKIRTGLDYEYSWMCDIRPNIHMVRKIIAGVREKANQARRKTEEKKLDTSTTQDTSVNQVISKLELDIKKIEKILEEKKTTLKVLKQMQSI